MAQLGIEISRPCHQILATAIRDIWCNLNKTINSLHTSKCTNNLLNMLSSNLELNSIISRLINTISKLHITVNPRLDRCHLLSESPLQQWTCSQIHLTFRYRQAQRLHHRQFHPIQRRSICCHCYHKVSLVKFMQSCSKTHPLSLHYKHSTVHCKKHMQG